MKERLMFWTPRILTALYAAFLAMFALDVFSENLGFRQTVVALTMHLIPSFIFIIVLAISFRWERVAGTLCILAALYYSWSVHFRPNWIAVIGGPLVVIGILYWVDGLIRRHQLLR